MTHKSKPTVTATIISPEMVWLVYFDEHKGKHFKELNGQAAVDFIENQKTSTK